MFTEAYCIAKGKVQGVGYRDFVAHTAEEHQLTGWVQNQKDGSVCMVLQGYPDDLKLCIERLHAGPPLARVESVSADWRTPAKQFDGFSVISL